MAKVRVVNIAAVKLFRGRTFERVGRRLADEGGQEFALMVCQEHFQYLGSA
jgi:hypothetical protein